MRLLLAALLVLAPLAAAAPQPTLYFLQDGASPLGDGALDSDRPDTNDTAYKLITYSPTGPTAWFAANASTDRLYGRAFVGLWPELVAVNSGNLSAGIYLDDGTDRTLISEASVALVLDPSKVPEPTSLIPPEPTDPEGAAFHIAGKLLPLLMSPPMLIDLGIIDMAVPEGSQLLLGLHLSPDATGTPPIGSVLVKYDTPTAPSFLYAPWYAPDPLRPTSTTGPSPSGTGTGGQTSSSSSSTGTSTNPTDFTGGSETSDSKDKDTPGLPIVFVGLALVAVALRRR